MIIDPKKLIKMAKKWQRAAAIRRKRISLPRSNGASSSSSSSPVATRGHFVVYTADQKRFVFPIEYLNNYVFRDLFKMSEEEFGLPRDRPITLPCDALFLEYAVYLIEHCATEATQKALVMSIYTSTRCCWSYHLHQRQPSQQLIVSSFWSNINICKFTPHYLYVM